MPVHLPRYRVPIPPPPYPTLIQTTSITLITLVSNKSSSPPSDPIHPNLTCALPLSLQLSNIPLCTLLSLPPPLIATTLSPSPNRLTLTSSSLLLSLSPSTYHSLGLATQKSLRPPQRLPSHQRKHPSFIPVQLPRNTPSQKLQQRLEWALHESRIGAPDVMITGDNAHIQTLAVKHGATPIPLRRETHTFHAPTWATPVFPVDYEDHEAVLEMADTIQRLAMDVGVGHASSEVTVHRSRYVGFCGADVGKSAVECMRACIKENRGNADLLGGIVLLRGLADGVSIWQNGRVRGGGLAGFDADSAEMFVWGPTGGDCVVQMRATVDEVG